jgi:hypothetical protein
VPEPTKAGGNKRAISLLSIINPPKRTVALPPFSASPEQSKKKKKRHAHAKKQKKNESRQPNTPHPTKAETKISPSKLAEEWNNKSKPSAKDCNMHPHLVGYNKEFLGVVSKHNDPMNGKLNLSGVSKIYHDLCNIVVHDRIPIPDWKKCLPNRAELHGTKF